MAQRSTNTMTEMLQRMLQDVSMAKTLPDADLEFLVGLETAILQKLRAPLDAQQGTPPGVQQQPMQGGPGPMPGPMPQGAGVPGVMSSPNMAPAADELRRVMGAGQQ